MKKNKDTSIFSEHRFCFVKRSILSSHFASNAISAMGQDFMHMKPHPRDKRRRTASIEAEVYHESGGPLKVSLIIPAAEPKYQCSSQHFWNDQKTVSGSWSVLT